MAKNVALEFDGNVALLTLQNPPVNTLSFQTMQDLHDALSEIEQREEISVVLLRGSNGHFAAGAELKEFLQIQTKAKGTETSYIGHHLMDRIESFPKFVIALIEGACLGGGLELALACHMRLGAEGSIYGLPEVTLGLIPGAGGTQRLPKLIGLSKAKRLILTGERLPAEQAEKLGILDGVCPPEKLEEEGRKLAEMIARNSPIAVSYALKAIHAGAFGSGKEGDRVEADLFGACFETEEKKRRVEAFLNRRK